MQRGVRQEIDSNIRYQQRIEKHKPITGKQHGWQIKKITMIRTWIKERL